MERILLFFALGVTAAEKLDRRYLPPPGAKLSGGNHEDLQVPYEFIKESSKTTPVYIQENGLLRSGYNNEPGPNLDLEKNVGDNFNLQAPKIDFLSTPPITPLEHFPTILASDDNYNTFSSPVLHNLTVDHFQRINDDLPKTSTQQKISVVAPDGSIILSYIENGRNYKLNKDTQPREYAPNATIMQVSTIKTDRNYEGNKLNETTLITDPKNQRPAGSNTIVISSQSKPNSLKATRSKISSINTKLHPERPQANNDQKARILNYHNIITPEGFSYSYDTSNSISARESGTATNGVRAKGAYAYKGDDDKIYKVDYTADENGFRAYGDHLPTPPPAPKAIQRLIEKAAREKEAGISDDGSYDETKYGYKKYHGAMERYHPEIQGITNFKGNLYDDYQKQKLGEARVHKKLSTSSKIIESESYRGQLLPIEYIGDDSITILPDQATSTVWSADDLRSVFLTGYLGTNARNPYIFTKDKLFISFQKEDDIDLKKPVESNISFESNKQDSILHFHTQNTLNIRNRNSNLKPGLHINHQFNSIKQAHVNTQIKNLAFFSKIVPEVIIQSDNTNLANVQGNEQDNMGYIYVTPATKFEETAFQNMNHERFPFDSDQELAIGDDEIITISVPLNTSNFSNLATLPTPATTDKYTTVKTVENIKDPSREFDYLDSSKIPLYFVDSTTMPSNINIDRNETLDTGLRSSITPEIGPNFSERYSSATPQELMASEMKYKSKIDPINQDYSVHYLDVTPELDGANTNLRSFLKNNLGVSRKGKLEIKKGNYTADTNIQQSYSKPYQAVNADGNSDVTLQPTPSGRIIGEDFSGPRRPQSFDPITGYHY